jgi:transposase InsO family protein
VCFDNAVAKSFWESLKRECLQDRVFATRAEARRAIFKWINWYNTERIHTSLGDLAPNGFAGILISPLVGVVCDSGHHARITL